jgi:hypothetical protein
VNRLTPLGVFAGAFICLLGAAAAAALSHFTASRIAPWLSIGYSGAAVVFTAAAIVMSRHE